MAHHYCGSFSTSATRLIGSACGGKSTARSNYGISPQEANDSQGSVYARYHTSFVVSFHISGDRSTWRGFEWPITEVAVMNTSIACNAASTSPLQPRKLNLYDPRTFRQIWSRAFHIGSLTLLVSELNSNTILYCGSQDDQDGEATLLGNIYQRLGECLAGSLLPAWNHHNESSLCCIIIFAVLAVSQNRPDPF